MSPAAAHALLHMLGLDADHRKPWRNHFVTGPDEGDDIRELVTLGYVVDVRRPGFLDARDRVFVATDAGKAAASEENQRANPPPKTNRRRYLHWLRISDADPDLTFGEYLRRRLYNDPAWGSP